MVICIISYHTHTIFLITVLKTSYSNLLFIQLFTLLQTTEIYKRSSNNKQHSLYRQCNFTHVTNNRNMKQNVQTTQAKNEK